MRRYYTLLWHFGKMSLLNQMAYPPSFFLAIAAKCLRVGVALIFFQALYAHTFALGEWDADHILLLIATYLTLEYAVSVTFHRNLAYYLPDSLRKATYDFVLTKPVNTLFYSAFRIIDFMDLISMAPIVVLWVIVFTRQLAIMTPGTLLLFLVLFALSYCFVFFWLLLISSLAFWSFTGTGIGRLFESVVRLSRFPHTAFQGAYRVLLLYVLPVVAAVSIPASVLRGTLEWSFVGFFTLYTVLLGTLALFVWRAAQRHYASASA